MMKHQDDDSARMLRRSQDSDMRILRSAVLNDTEPPLDVVCRLQAMGLDVDLTISRLQQMLGVR